MSSTQTFVTTATQTTDGTKKKSQQPVFWQPTGVTVEKKLSEQLGVVAIDNSGSTSGSILMDQKKTANEFGPNLTDRTVLWNSTCSDVKKLNTHMWRSNGGTTPSCIFTPKIKTVLNSANILGIWTDGEIMASDVPAVQRVASSSIGHMSTILVVTILRQITDKVVNAFNISVMAPFRDSCSDSILLVRIVDDPDDKIHNCPVFRVVQTSGAFSGAWESPEINNQTKISELQFVTAKQIMEIKLTVRERPPPGFLPVGQHYINLKAVVTGATLTDQEILTLLEDPVKLAQVAQSTGLLNDLRARILVMERQLTNWAKTETERELNIIVNDKFGTTGASGASASSASGADSEVNEVNLMRQLQELKNQNQKDSPEFKTIQAKLHKFRQIRSQAQIEYNRIYKRIAGDLINKTQSALAVIGEAERAGFGADALTRLNQTNRALRAKTVSVADINQIVYDDSESLAGECSICYEVCGPGTGQILCLRVKCVNADDADKNIRKKNPDGSQALGDAIQSMPLAFGASAHNQIFLPDEPMCLHCARSFNRSVLTMEDVNGIIPLISLKTQASRDLMLDHIAIAIAGGKVMGPWWQLFVAMLDHSLNHSGFCDENHSEMHQAMEYSIQQILGHVKTAKTLQEGCTETVPLMHAINNVLAGCPTNDSPMTPYIHKYFFNGVACMLSLMRFSKSGLPDAGFKLLHHATAKQLVMIHLSTIKNRNDAIQPARLALYEKLFKCRYGVPIAGTAHLVTIDDLMAVFSADITQALNHWCRKNGKSLAEFIQLPAMTLLWWNLVNLTTHDRPDACIEKFQLQDAMLNSCFTAPDSITSQDVINYLNQQFTRIDVNEQHTQVKFASAVGPSKLQCSCGYKFLPLVDRQKPLVEMARIAHKRRAAHFEEVYKSNAYGNPSDQSGHYNIHKAIQRTFDPALTDQENVERAIKYVVKDDRRGYIYCPVMEAEARSAVESFRPFANEWLTAFGALSQPSMELMIDYELKHVKQV